MNNVRIFFLIVIAVVAVLIEGMRKVFKSEKAQG